MNLYIRYPSNIAGIPTYPNFASLPSSPVVIEAITLDTLTLYLYDTMSAMWKPIASPDTIFGVSDTNSMNLTVISNILSADLKLSAMGPDLNNTAIDLSIQTDGLKAQIPNADTSTDGALTATDWNTFNDKQPAGDYITDLTGDVSASGPGSVASTVNFVGGESAADVASATIIALAATSTNTPNTIVLRDGSGGFEAGTIVADALGLGVALPSEQLDMTGNINLPASTSTTGIIKVDGTNFLHSFNGGIYLGPNAGNFTSTGIFLLGIGDSALASNTTGNYNAAIGSLALSNNDTGSFNLAVGTAALLENTSGLGNSGVGLSALQYNTIGNMNTAVGAVALQNNVNGNANTAIGINALVDNINGGANTGIGVQALENNIDGEGNTAIGYLAGSSLTTGTGNTFIGAGAGSGSPATLNNSTAIGYSVNVQIDSAVVIGSTSQTIGFGNESPIAKIDVDNSANASIEILKLKGAIGQTADSILIIDSSSTVLARITAEGKLSLPSGSAASPSLFFTTESDSGIYSDVADEIVIATSGTERFRITATGDIDTTLSTGLVHSDASGILSSSLLVNADVDAAAAIARSKLASGSANHVIINDGSGVMSSEAQLAMSRGGTGQATATNAFNALSPLTTKGDLVTHDGTNNVRQGVGSNGQALVADSAQTNGIKWANVTVTRSSTVITNASSPYSATSANDIILANATSGAITVNLPAAGSNTNLVLTIRKTDSTTNAVTLDGNASETINGFTTYKLVTQNDTVVIYCDGSNWLVLDHAYPQTWKALTGWSSGGFTINSSSIFARREGDSLHVRGWVEVTSLTASPARLLLPSGYVLDTAKNSTGTNNGYLGVNVHGQSATKSIGSNDEIGAVFSDNSATDSLFITNRTTSFTFEARNGSDFLTSSDLLHFDAIVPMSGWPE